MKIRIFIRI